MNLDEYKYKCLTLICNAEVLEFPKISTENKKMELIDKHKEDIEKQFKKIIKVDIDDRLWDRTLDLVSEKFGRVKLNNEYLQELMKTYAHVLYVFYQEEVK